MLWETCIYGGDDKLLVKFECHQPDAAFAIEQAALLVRAGFGSHAHIQRIVVRPADGTRRVRDERNSSGQAGEGQVCPCDREKWIDPWCCAAGECVREEIEMERAELGVDGNCGFALLGEDLQAGEAEFVEITLPVEASKDPNRYHHSEWCDAAKRAATAAYRALKARLPNREFSYYIGPSHPDHC